MFYDEKIKGLLIVWFIYSNKTKNKGGTKKIG